MLILKAIPVIIRCFVNNDRKNFHDYTNKDLAYLSSGLTKYVVTKGFTIWTIKKKHTIGEEFYIGDHNRNVYEWAIKGGLLKEV